ncbi:hypothetical protein [Moorena producens]|nr:hypothetical protein [Moorena producens]
MKTQNFLGLAYYHRLQEEAPDNKHLAIEAFQDALTVFTSG